MNTLLPLADEFVGLIVVCGATLLTGLVMRNPHAPQLLRREFAAQAASLVLTAMLLFFVAYAYQGFIAVGLGPIIAALAVAGVLTVSTLVFWKVLRVGERLRRADSGRSPFERSAATTATPRGVPHQPISP